MNTTSQDVQNKITREQSPVPEKHPPDQLQWIPCKLDGDSFVSECPGCNEKLSLPLESFRVDATSNPENLVATGQSIRLLRGWASAIGSFLAIGVAVMIGTRIGQYVQIPFVWAIIAVLLLPILKPIFINLFPYKSLRLWEYTCPACHREIPVGSDGRQMYFGKRDQKVSKN